MSYIKTELPVTDIGIAYSTLHVTCSVYDVYGASAEVVTGATVHTNVDLMKSDLAVERNIYSSLFNATSNVDAMRKVIFYSTY